MTPTYALVCRYATRIAAGSTNTLEWVRCAHAWLRVSVYWVRRVTLFCIGRGMRNACAVRSCPRILSVMTSTGPPEDQTPVWTFGDKVRKVRLDLTGLTQAGFAQEIGVNPHTLAAWESGRNRAPRGDELVGIARRIHLLTGVSVAWLIDLEPDADAHLPMRNGR